MFLTPSLLGWRLMDFMEFVATLARTGSVSVLHSLVILLDHESVGVTSCPPMFRTYPFALAMSCKYLRQLHLWKQIPWLSYS